MEDINLLSHWLFLYGPLILYLVIGIVVHLSYGKGGRGTKKEDAS